MKKLKILLLIVLFLLIVLPFANVKALNKKVTELEVSESKNGVITIQGTAENGMLAAAIMVYDATGEELITMQSVAVSNNHKFNSIINLEQGKYLVKVADYDGGDYTTKVVEYIEDNDEVTIIVDEDDINSEELLELAAQIVDDIIADKNVEGVSEELKEILLDAIDNGSSIAFKVVSEEANEEEAEADIAKVTGALKEGEKVAGYLNIRVAIGVDGVYVGDVTVLAEKVTVEVDMPNDLPKVEAGHVRKFFVIRVHNGETQRLEAKVNGDKLTFENDLFSTFAIGYEDVAETVPNTGDKLAVYIGVAMIAISGLGAVILINKKLNQN